ncbi:hypothetical protein Trco_000187 [Trichoderma cornu-damae]|uniref:Uncharacterized protein n=1 Tax=Trichoderma cornu-damae TaxID=654480 RepID=A0A9P8QX01_9HYPO|nr:hypothetical protein Trco_000187 [Trichoderma cornu-damae]
MSATQTEVMLLNRKSSRTSTLASAVPPAYESGSYIELRNLSTTSSRSSSSPPQYDDVWASSASSSRPTFHCTKAFQIDARGHPLIALPISPRRIPIPVYNVDLPSGAVTDLAYESIRPMRCSGNSILIRAGDSEHDPICRTTYRFGPGRPPKMELSGLMARDEEFEVVSKGFTTRAQVFRTHLGTFQWRYAGREERRAAGADNLLMLDRITMVALEGGDQEEKRAPVARLVRNAEVRPQGTRVTTAGNGGRLMMNLREWEGTKGEAEQMEVLVVASCLVMLKKEIDRRRMHQAIAMTSSGC